MNTRGKTINHMMNTYQIRNYYSQVKRQGFSITEPKQQYSKQQLTALPAETTNILDDNTTLQTTIRVETLGRRRMLRKLTSMKGISYDTDFSKLNSDLDQYLQLTQRQQTDPDLGRKMKPCKQQQSMQSMHVSTSKAVREDHHPKVKSTHIKSQSLQLYNMKSIRVLEKYVEPPRVEPLKKTSKLLQTYKIKVKDTDTQLNLLHQENQKLLLALLKSNKMMQVDQGKPTHGVKLGEAFSKKEQIFPQSHSSKQEISKIAASIYYRMQVGQHVNMYV